MIRIGTVNIDTSHAPSFAEILLKEDRARYTAIYNDGFRNEKDVNDFIEKYHLEARYTDLSEMAKHIDVAFIQSCDWDRHIELAKPFVDAGVPVFIDKPLVGNMKDVHVIEKWANEGKVILGTSAMRYTYEHDDFFSQDKSENIVTLTTTVGVDEFNYAIHAVEEILGFMGKIRPVSTEFIGDNTVDGVKCESYRVMFENGASAYYHTGLKGWQFSTAVVMCKSKTYVYKIDSNKVYEAMLKQVCNYFEGKENNMASTESMLDAVKIMLAGRKSKFTGFPEMLSELTEDDPLFHGKQFYEGYKAANGY